MSAHTPCLFCEWCQFNLRMHGQAYLSLCDRYRSWNTLHQQNLALFVSSAKEALDA